MHTEAKYSLNDSIISMFCFSESKLESLTLFKFKSNIMNRKAEDISSVNL